MSKKKILIITYNWPPRNAIGTHRPYAWAKNWASLDTEITVLTAKKYDFDEPLDLSLPEIPKVRVYELPYLKSSRYVFKLFKIPLVNKLVKKIKVYSKIKKKNSFIDVRGGWEVASLPYLDRLAFDNDIVISSYGPAATHRIASRIKQINPNIFWVADYRDLWSLNHLANIDDSTLTSTRSEEIDTVSSADLLSTVSEGLAQDLKGLFTNKDISVIYNGFDTSLNKVLSNINNKAYIKRDIKRIVYTGRLYLGRQDPIPLLQAVKDLSDAALINEDSITVDFYGASSFDAKQILNKHPEFTPYVRLLGHVKRDKAIRAQENADLLLLLESEVEGAKGILTGKIFEYIVSGTPIINIGNVEDSGINCILRSTSTGVSVGKDVNEIKSIVKKLYANERYQWFQPNFSVISEYARDTQAERFFETILYHFNNIHDY